MAKEVFFENVRSAVWGLSDWSVPEEGTGPNPENMSRSLELAFVWLSPSSVRGFDSNDFSNLPPAQQEELGAAVEGFLAVASALPPNTRPSEEQRREAMRHFLHIATTVSRLAREEWVAELRWLIDEIKGWAAQHEWGVKEDSKKLKDRFLGTYHVPRLLIHTVGGRLLVDPVARFVAAESGLVDLAVIPSFDSAMIVRTETGWVVYPDRRWEAAEPLTAETFVNTVQQLLAAHETA